MKNRISHIEFASTNRESSGKFFADLFGWPVENVEPMNYVMTRFPEGETSMGFVPVDESQGIEKGNALIYVYISDIDATIAKAKELNAPIYLDKTEVQTIGWMAIFGDPGGNRIAVMEPMPQPE